MCQIIEACVVSVLMSGVSTYPGQLKIRLHAHDKTDAGQEHTETLRIQVQYKQTHTRESYRPAHTHKYEIGLEVCLNPSCPHTEIHTYSKRVVT